MASHPEHPPEWIDEAPVTVERTVEIDAPPERVWARIADHETWPEWFGPLANVEVTGAASGVGGRRRVTIKGVPPIDEVFTAWDENERFAFAVVGSKVPFLAGLAESVEIEPIDTGCRVTYRQGLELTRGFGWVAALAANRLGTQLTAALDQLAVRVESAPS